MAEVFFGFSFFSLSLSLHIRSTLVTRRQQVKQIDVMRAADQSTLVEGPACLAYCVRNKTRSFMIFSNGLT